jgi:hypothetical protein
MASTQTTDVLRRLLEDDSIHEHLATASAGARGAYRRARRLPPDKAVADEALYARVRQVATGLVAAGRAALGRPEPEPKRGSKLLMVTVLGATVAAVVWAARRDAEARANRAAAAAGPGPVAPG